MKRLIRSTALLLTAAFLLTMFAGCKKTDKNEKIVISILFSQEFPEFEKYVEATYSDIDLHCERTPAPTEISRRLANGVGPELVVTTQVSSEHARKYLLDISDTNASTAYDGTVTKQAKVDGKTYLAPLPGQYLGYIINETLFKEAGLSIPTSNEELKNALSVLKEKNLGVGEDGSNFAIHELYNTDVANYYIANMVPDFLGTIEGVEWLDAYFDKRAVMVGTWEDAFTFGDELIEEGFWHAESVGRLRNASRVKDRMADGTLAVGFGSSSLFYKCISQNEENVQAGTASEYTYRMLPIFSDDGWESWVLFSPAAYIGINNDVTEAEKDACLRIIELLSTQEGQGAIQKDLDMGVSSLKDYEPANDARPLGIEDRIDAGFVYNINLPENISDYFGSLVRKMMAGKMTSDEILEAMDKYYTEGSQDVDYDISIIGETKNSMIMQDYNVRLGETEIGNFIADCVAFASDAPIAVVNGGGIRSSFYEGYVHGEDLAVVCPFDNLIVVLEMDGQTLWDMLENGVSMLDTEVPGGRFLQVSGICYTFDSQKPVGSRIQKVTLADGTAIDLKGKYKVAVNNYMAGSQTYVEGNGDGYTMLNCYDDTSQKGNVKLVAETNLTYRDAMKEYFEKKATTVDVKLEGRITDTSSADKN